MGYSNRIHDPAFAKYRADSERYARIFAFILATAAVLGFYLYGEFSTEMDNPEALYIGLGIGGMFIAIALITNRSKKGAKTWDGKVCDKQVRKKDAPSKNLGPGLSCAGVFALHGHHPGG